MSRRRFLTDDRRQQACHLIASGATLANAAHFLGCSPRTLRRESLRNQAFRDAIQQAREKLAAEEREFRDLFGPTPRRKGGVTPAQTVNNDPKADEKSPKADQLPTSPDRFVAWFFRTLIAKIEEKSALAEGQKEAA